MVIRELEGQGKIGSQFGCRVKPGAARLRTLSFDGFVFRRMGAMADLDTQARAKMSIQSNCSQLCSSRQYGADTTAL